jgi:hypothetical protein
MDRIYNLKTMIQLILPDKYYKGCKLFELENSIPTQLLTPISPITDDENLDIKDA